MANGQGQPADAPAPESVIDDLPRVVLEDNREHSEAVHPLPTC